MDLYEGQPQSIQKEQHLNWKVTVSILDFFLCSNRAEKDTIPVLQTIEKLKSVETVSASSKNCNQDLACDYYKLGR